MPHRELQFQSLIVRNTVSFRRTRRRVIDCQLRGLAVTPATTTAR
uniref:Uncharacterized protein n=1 Tax=Rhizophora mucronata TaxID=61149 RepID=A0A2P2PBA5_RHIMU